MKDLMLFISGALFGLVGVVHLIRFLLNWPFIVGGWHTPRQFSIIVCIILLILSVLCFVVRG